MADISVTELKARLHKGERPNLIDVREGYERQAPITKRKTEP